jgi:F-type H+-transporting ATPase subunit b
MDLLQPEAGLIFWTAVTFALVLGILWKFAWNPILGALEAREEAIRKTIDDAERLQAEAKKLLEQHEARLAEARTEGNRILDEARQAGDRLKGDVMDKARTEAEQVMARAHRQLELETDQALETIRNEAASLAVKAAEKVIQRSLTDDDHQRFAEQAVAEIARTEG